MDFGVILIVLFIIGSSIYKHYKEQMEKSNAPGSAAPAGEKVSSGKGIADKILQQIMSEIEKNKEALGGGDKAAEVESLPFKAHNLADRDEKEESPVEEAAQEAKQRAVLPLKKSPAPLKDKKREKVVLRKEKDKFIDLESPGSLARGVVYAEVLAPPVCKRHSKYPFARPR